MFKRKRSQQLKLDENDLNVLIEKNYSGVENFPTITDYKNQFLISVLSIENFEKHLKIVGELKNNSNKQNQKVELFVKDFWRDSNFFVGTNLRLIAPLIISDRVKFLLIN